MTRAGIALYAVLGVVLALAFGRYMPLSGDITQHFMLVDELTKYGDVRPSAGANLGMMSVYPNGSHWLASVVGRVVGSPMLGITMVAAVSLFACYVLMFKIVGENSRTAVIGLVAAFIVLSDTQSLIGWEVWVNFFYPQLVADVLFLGMILWLSGDRPPYLVVVVAAMAGYVAIWVQPLIALHLLAGTLMVLAVQGAIFAYRNRRFPAEAICMAAVLLVASSAMFLLHPSVRAMRAISQNDGYLEFSYIHPTTVAAICALIGIVTLVIHMRRETPRVDMVLGASVIASAVLVALQSAAFHVLHLGSHYAIKKHMFIVFTLAVLNIVRIGVQLVGKREFRQAWVVTPVAAALMSAYVLRCFTFPVAPVDEAIHFANTEAREFKSGSVVSATTLPPMVNFMISQSSFQHPFDMTALSWMQGANPAVGAQLVMVEGSTVRPECHAETGAYVVVAPACLRNQ